MSSPGSSAVVAALALFGAALASTPNPARRVGSEIEFDRDVLPILGAKCLGCHSGPSPKARLDLLSRKHALAGTRARDPAVVPGNPDASRLIAVVSGEDALLRMPPRGDALTADEIKILRAWIADGARWSPAAESLIGKPWHWAYRAPVGTHPPKTAEAAWQKSPIDGFVLAKLGQHKLSHAPLASRATLARRLSLAITGLLPEPKDVAAFVADEQPDAVERYVDRALASPHYGERMARMWLDLARYADTNGYEKDDRRSIWPWRDWVIDAFNENLPYDRFALEQMAGDLLEDSTVEARVATGFHRNTMTNEEGGTDPEEFRVEAVHDRVHTTASVFLGSTLACARCHDHKFDPFTIEDYYGFFAFLNGDRADTTVVGPSEQRAAGATLAVAPRDRRQEYAGLIARRDAALAAIAEPREELRAAQEQWEGELRSGPSPWSVLAPTKLDSESGATLTRAEDGSILVAGELADSDVYRLEFTLSDAGARALRLEVLPEPSSASRGVGRAAHGNFVLSELEAESLSADGNRRATVRFAGAIADHEQRGNGESWLASHAIDGDRKTGWAIAPEFERAHELVLEADEAFGDAVGASFWITLVQGYGGGHTLARLRVSTSSRSDSASLAPRGAAIAAVLDKSPGARSPAEMELVAAHYRAHAPALADLRKRLREAEAQLARIPLATTLVMERAAEVRATHVMRKGNFLDPGVEVVPALPAVVGALPAALPRNRLGLARWIASAENPLFARVFVNHVWELHFGRGLVASTDDFGTQGEPPSHPELLDDLASRFVESGFDVKALQRRILTSQTFLQDSRLDQESLERDPANRFLARGPRFRMEAEALRDVALCASGLLVRDIGGPSVFPPQPPGIWTMIYSNDRWTESVGPDRYRRGLYTFCRRTAPYPTSALFDAPSREVTCTRRSRTNTPLQALALLNDPQFVECAVGLARRMLQAGRGVEADTLQSGFHFCLSRAAGAEELETLLELYRGQRAIYSQDQASAKALVGNGPEGAPPDSDLVDLAAWTVVANVLLNLDETLSQQ